MKEENTSNFLTTIEDSFFGGTITVGSQLSWILLLLLKNPDYAMKTQKEIDSVLGNNKNCMKFK